MWDTLLRKCKIAETSCFIFRVYNNDTCCNVSRKIHQLEVPYCTKTLWCDKRQASPVRFEAREGRQSKIAKVWADLIGQAKFCQGHYKICFLPRYE